MAKTVASAEVASAEPAERRSWMPNSSRMSEQTFAYLLTIPVVVLTTSSADIDVMGAYRHHVNAYIIKPVDLDQFIAAIKTVEQFWLGVVRLPR